MKKQNKQALILITCFTVIALIGVFIGSQIPLEYLRLEMEEKNLVFCTPVYNDFGEQYAIPTNITWYDLESTT